MIIEAHFRRIDHPTTYLFILVALLLFLINIDKIFEIPEIYRYRFETYHLPKEPNSTVQCSAERETRYECSVTAVLSSMLLLADHCSADQHSSIRHECRYICGNLRMKIARDLMISISNRKLQTLFKCLPKGLEVVPRTVTTSSCVLELILSCLTQQWLHQISALRQYLTSE